MNLFIYFYDGNITIGFRLCVGLDEAFQFLLLSKKKNLIFVSSYSY